MVTIRPARAEDDAPLLVIDLATWTTNTSPAPAPLPADHPTFFTGDRGQEGYLVADVDGVVGGYVSVHQNIPLASHAHVLEINGLAVAPAVQGRGVGRALVEGAVTHARNAGATKVTLRVLSPNTSARRLYERCGFVVEGVLRGEFVLDDQRVDDILMARHLS